MPNVGLCRDCKHWTSRYGDDVLDFAPFMPIGQNVCDLMTTYSASLQHETKAAAYNGEEYGSSYVFTAPDFGCVMFDGACGDKHPKVNMYCRLPHGHLQQHEQWDPVYPSITRVQWAKESA